MEDDEFGENNPEEEEEQEEILDQSNPNYKFLLIEKSFTKVKCILESLDVLLTIVIIIFPCSNIYRFNLYLFLFLSF